jgi:hypothetical protein
MKRGCARRSVSRRFQLFFPKGLENSMSVVELHAEVLYLLLRVDHAPTLRRDDSIDGLAGGGGSNSAQSMAVTPVTAPAAPTATVNTRRPEILLESVIVTVLLC